MAAHSNQWATGPSAPPAPMPHQQQQQQPQQQGDGGFGPQTRPMGLKVQYTFDKDGQVNCLARWPHILHIQTVPLDEQNTIGVVDLRTCLTAVAQCSPEIVNQQEYDYTVYASDYSEPDVPLVGQGMLSWGLDPNSDPQSQQLVTGRVTRNLMALFGKGNSDTLEVRLKLTAVPRMHRGEQPRGNPEQHHQQHQHQRQSSQHHHKQSVTSQPDAAHSEWNSLIQSNPGLGQSNVARYSSPQGSQARMGNATPEMRYGEQQPQNYMYQQDRPPSAAPVPLQGQVEEPLPRLPQLPQHATQTTQPSHLPPPPTSDIAPEKPSRPSRPASRQRSRVPTGRPRGRPRKKPLDNGHTSGAEMTDGDDGPKQKRAKVVPQAEYNTTAAFVSHPDSLRVAASTSGSLRNMRPIGPAGGMPAGNHLQDVPRAPTPVPNAMQQQNRQCGPLPRQNSMTSLDMYQMPGQSTLRTSMSVGNMGQDARSPTDSIAQSPDQGYTPEYSPADIGSSPPVPRTRVYPQSSPAPSSPPLPPVDSGFMSGGMDDLFDEDDMAQDLPMQDGLPDMLPKLPVIKPAPRRQQAQGVAAGNNPAQQQEQPFLVQEVNSGSRQMLPQQNLSKPTGKGNVVERRRVLDAAQAAIVRPFQPTGPPVSTVLPPAPRMLQFQRSHTAPMPPRSDSALAAETSPVSKAAFEVPVESVESTDTMTPAAPQAQEHSHRVSGQSPVTVDIPATKRRDSPAETTTRPRSVALEEQQRRATPVSVSEPAAIAAPPMQTSAPEAASTGLPHSGPQLNDFELQRTGSEPLYALLNTPAASAPPAASTTQSSESALPLPPMRPPSPRTQSLPPPVPASDPIQQTFLSLPQLPEVPHTDAPCPTVEESEQGEQRKSKNLVKKKSIKDRLETAIAKGEMPPFCNNCGAIETPTWRKIWTQEHQGVPGLYEFSDKPGCVTCIDILEKGPSGQPTLYRLVKKNLSKDEDRLDWKELLLCNPCGIWLAKFKGHRPPDRWDKDAERLNQPRKKKGQGEKSRANKRQRTKSGGDTNLTSDVYPMTDPFGPEDNGDQQDGEDTMRSRRQSTQFTEGDREQSQPAHLNLLGPAGKSAPGSTHSRGSGTQESPIALEDTFDAPPNLGGTRRLLFPSPRKDGVPKILGELEVNVVQTAPDFQHPKPAASMGKENVNQAPARATTPSPPDDDDLDQELFGTPPVRPSTPTHKSTNGPFKTPTRPTPSHRPITRSISRSIRSGAKSSIFSPSQALLQLQRTPSKTPRSAGGGGAINFSLGLSYSASKRKTPRNNNAALHAHFALDSADFDSPFTATINQLLSEANEFTSGSPSHGLDDMVDLSSLPNLHSDDVMQQLAAATSGANGEGPGSLDFGHFLSATDMAALSSSPPVLGRNQRQHSPFHDIDDGAIADMWAKLSAADEAHHKAA